MTAGTRFTLGCYHASPNGPGYDCGTETREKIEGGSRVVETCYVRTLPDFESAQTWSREFNRLEAERLIAVGEGPKDGGR